MDKHIYVVKIEGGTKDYIQGRISGIMTALDSSDDCTGFAIKEYIGPKHWWQRKCPVTLVEMRIECTEEDFKKMMACINKHYPNLCKYYRTITD